MSKILLHTCCAPCTTYINEWLKGSGFETAGFFYNQNIYPAEEYEKRKRCMEYYSAISSLDVTYVEEDSPPLPGNCEQCYETRLRKTAQFARHNGFELFTTTLLISPYQKHDIIRAIGSRIAEEEGVGFLYHDFREGYYKSRELSARYNLYRQKYCGCSASHKEREIKNEQVA